MKYFKLLLKGFCMGTANAIPGVSGGTIAFLLGFYEELITSINKIDINLFKLILSGKWKAAIDQVPWKFFFSLGFGVIAAILSLSKLLVWLMLDYPIFINAFFFGLIIATAPIIGKIIKKWTTTKVFALIVSTILTYYLVNLVPINTPNHLVFIFLCGIIAISSMILPGISGSFMLLLLGKYIFILEAINNRDLNIIAVFSAGAFVGIISFVRLLSWLFKKHHDLTVAVLTGFVLGSACKIWPWKQILETMTKPSGKIIPIKTMNAFPGSFDHATCFAFGLIIIGIISAMLLNRTTSKKIL